MTDFADLQRILALEAEIAGLKLTVATLEARNLHLEARKSIDELTGLHSRCAFDERLVEEIELARREKGISLVLVMFDLDHFKAVNDTYGHPVGDDVLRSVGKAVRGHARASDFAARVGGEEFALILSSTSPKKASGLIERLRKRIASLRIDAGGETIQVTASFGVVAWDEKHSAASLYGHADTMLYMAKNLGRNRVQRA